MIARLEKLKTRIGVVALLWWLALGTATSQVSADTKMPSPDGIQRMDQVWMIVFVDKGGVESLAQAKTTAGDYVPLIAADQARLESMLEVAQEMARALNRE